jgi:hypothetical protein
LIAGPRVITITGVLIDMQKDQPVSISFEGDSKVFRPCKSMRKMLIVVWGADASKYIGRSLDLFLDSNVTWGGASVGGVRISKMTHIEKPVTVMLTVSRGKRAPFVVQPMADPRATPEPVDHTALAITVAAGGKAEFTAWWNSDVGKTCRSEGLVFTDAIKAAIIAADTPEDDEEIPM